MPKFSSCPRGVVMHSQESDPQQRWSGLENRICLLAVLDRWLLVTGCKHTRGCTRKFDCISFSLSFNNQPNMKSWENVSWWNYIIPLKEFILRGPQRSIIFVAYPSETVAMLFPYPLRNLFLVIPPIRNWHNPL